MFSKYVLFKKGHLNKTAGVWTPCSPPPGSATAIHDPAIHLRRLFQRLQRYTTHIRENTINEQTCPNQLNSFRRFDGTPTCDGQTQTDTGPYS